MLTPEFTVTFAADADRKRVGTSSVERTAASVSFGQLSMEATEGK
jgi:hypothetical protein